MGFGVGLRLGLGLGSVAPQAKRACACACAGQYSPLAAQLELAQPGWADIRGEAIMRRLSRTCSTLGYE